MDLLTGAAADALFAATVQQQDQRDALSGTVLATGIDLYQKGNYSGAANAFKRVVGLSPFSDNALKAYDYMANAYLKMNDIDKAESAYKDSIKSYPNQEDSHIKLGNLYYSQNRFGEAEKEYESAIKANPVSSTGFYSLGQVYMGTGRYGEAEAIFKKVIAMSPKEYGGFYSLGQTYSKEGKYEDAVKQFKTVISLKKDFAYAYADLGYAYSDMGQVDDAKEQADILKDMDSGMADELNNYIYKAAQPKFLAVDTGAFDAWRGPRTQVAQLDDSLAGAGGSKEFTVNFYFNKEMDAASVQNAYNWSISRSVSSGPGGVYNWGLQVPSTEVTVPPIPVSVVYDPKKLTAQLTFSIDQNAAADGTIDPSHIVFRFHGIDAYGKMMDAGADEYSGVSQIA